MNALLTLRTFWVIARNMREAGALTTGQWELACREIVRLATEAGLDW